MGTTHCQEPHCTHPVGEQGRRGYCPTHYRKHIANQEPCSITDCHNVIGKDGRRGYCSTHYQRWKKHGDAHHPVHKPMPKVRFTIDKPCNRCGQRFKTARKNALYCETCRQLSNPGYVPTSQESRACADCGTHIPGKPQGAPKGRPRTLCRGCCKKRERLADKTSGRKADAARRRRARKRGAFVARVYSAKIYERDGWRCQLCGKPINPKTVVPHPYAGTIDHILPLAKGGTHEPANVQAAHFICNSIKSDKGTDQLRLIG